MELLSPNIGLIVFLLLGLGIVAVYVYAITDILRSRFEEGHHQIMWILVILLMPFLGTMLYFSIGSRHKVEEAD